jgi:hypothetical protein
MAKAYTQGQDLEKANRVTNWRSRIADQEEANDLEAKKPAPNSQDRIIALQAKYAKERTDAVVRVNKIHIAQIEAALRTAMQRADLPVANVLQEFLNKLKAENAPAGPLPAGAIAVLAVDQQKRWKPKGGEWKWDGAKLIGSGAGTMTYDLAMPPPFVAQFKFNPVKGLRAGVHFGSVSLHNSLDDHRFGLSNTDKKTFVPYQSNTVYRCLLVVTAKHTQLYVDGKLIGESAGRDKATDRITIHAGDDWSKGGVEVEDLIVYRGTDKIP